MPVTSSPSLLELRVVAEARLLPDEVLPAIETAVLAPAPDGSVAGRALELSTDRYRPSREMVEHVRAVDGVCRAPGCQVPADRCDLDHLVPWPAGLTEVANAQSLSRGCHNATVRPTFRPTTALAAALLTTRGVRLELRRCRGVGARPPPWSPGPPRGHRVR